jgi:hypothetical protein
MPPIIAAPATKWSQSASSAVSSSGSRASASTNLKRGWLS